MAIAPCMCVYKLTHLCALFLFIYFLDTKHQSADEIGFREIYYPALDRFNCSH